VHTRHPTHPAEFGGLDPTGLRERFLVEELFADGHVRLEYSHNDRMVVGGAVPAGQALSLPVPDQLRAEHFCDRRSMANLEEHLRYLEDGLGLEVIALRRRLEQVEADGRQAGNRR